VRSIVLVPSYNEVATLASVVSELRERRPDLDVLVVDDASTDGTGDLLASLDASWLQLGQHLGVGGAVRAGLRFARGLGYECVLRIDADGQHAAQQLDRLTKALAEGEADAAVGTRFRGSGGERPVGLRRIAHRAIAACLSGLTGRPVTDPTSGLWAFGARAVVLLSEHYPRGYSEPELLLFLHRNGLRVVEVPVEMRARQGGRSSLTLPRALIALGRTALVMLVAPFRSAVGGRRRHA